MLRGEILYHDAERGTGFINGEDGNRYHYVAADLAAGFDPGKGARIVFAAHGNQAVEISPRDAPRQRHEPRAGTPSVPSVAAATAEIVPPAAETGLFGYFLGGMTARYARFRGRARRKEYWGFVLFSFILILAAGFAGALVDLVVGNLDREEPLVAIGLSGVAGLAVLLPSLAVTVRRIHDIGLSGWFILVGLIPTIGNLIILVFAVMPSQKHPNRWGDVPPGAA